ncbi:serine hydrolase [Pseudarthrobacter albicanus]|uniref:serine hydrolase n=1 Tax=Pseudarthrobacter albicanus TaxID=2823873 RepID=UPI001BA50BFA|nr:serine hydrolase [Pseudarthrobacter albicanus]
MNTSGPISNPRVLALMWLATLLVIVATVLFAVVRTGPVPKTPFLAVASAAELRGVAPASNAVPNAGVDLGARLQGILDENGDHRIGVAVVDTRNGKLQAFGDASPYVAASTAKIITAAAYYHLVETGEKSLDAPLGSFDAGFQVKAMVNTSSDDSWLLLMQDIGYPRLIEYAGSIGLDYDPEQNLLTPPDMALLLTALSAGKLLNPGHTQELLGYMQQTNDEDLIPAALDPDITVHHKYGVVEGYVHDAAILSSGDRSYAVAIYTWGPDDADSEDRLGIIHKLTREITGALFRQ